MHLEVAHLDKEMQTMKSCQDVKQEQIGDLHNKVSTLEANADKREQYTRRPNLRFHGIPEVDGDNTNAVMIATIWG